MEKSEIAKWYRQYYPKDEMIVQRFDFTHERTGFDCKKSGEFIGVFKKTESGELVLLYFGATREDIAKSPVFQHLVENGGN